MRHYVAIPEEYFVGAHRTKKIVGTTAWGFWRVVEADNRKHALRKCRRRIARILPQMKIYKTIHIFVGTDPEHLKPILCDLPRSRNAPV